jgi:hypothetical protein
VLIAVGWLLLVSWLVKDVLFKVELRSVAVGWQLWISSVVSVVLFKVELGVGAVGPIIFSNRDELEVIGKCS